MRKVIVWLYTLTLILGGVGTGKAVPLQNLFNGGELIVDDKRFFNWNLDFQLATDPIFDPDFTLIEVLPLADEPLNPGFRIEANDQLTVTDQNFLDVSFSFNVEVTDPRMLIKDNSLKIDDLDLVRTDIVNGDPLIAITEDVFDAAGNLLASKLVEADLQFEQLFDSAEFAPQKSIFVEKNILVAGLAPGDVASLISFEQRFSQTMIPEPSTLLMFGIGVFCILGYGCKRKAATNGGK